MILVLLIFNFLIFSLFEFYFWKFHRTNTALLYLGGIWVYSAFSSIFFSEWGDDIYYNKSFEGYLLFYLYYIISIIPLLKVNLSSTRRIVTNEKVIRCISLILLYFSIIPLIYNLLEFRHIIGDANYFIDMHDARFSTNVNVGPFNVIYSFFYRPIAWCSGILPVLLMYNIGKYEKINKYSWGIILAQIVSILGSTIGSSRFPLVDAILSYLFAYFLMKNSLSNKANKLCKRVLKSVGIVLVGMLLTITVSRAVSMGYVDYKKTYAWISLYTGEGILNYNEYLMHQKIQKGYVYLVPFIADSQTKRKLKNQDRNERTSYWYNLTGKPENRLYTFYGQLIDTIGKYKAAITLICISVFMCFLLKKRRYYLSTLAIYLCYARTIYMGFMYSPYTGENGNQYLIHIVVVIGLIYYFENKYAKKRY